MSTKKSQYLLDIYIMSYQKDNNLKSLMFKVLRMSGLSLEDFHYLSSILEFGDEWAEFHYQVYSLPNST